MATAITVVCPQCNNRMRASSEYIGARDAAPLASPWSRSRPVGEESLKSLHPAAAPVRHRRETDARLSSTNAPVWLAGLIGLGATVALYAAIFFPLRSERVHKWIRKPAGP